MSLRTKIVTILVVFVVFFAIGVYPILASLYSLPAPDGSPRISSSSVSI